MLSDSDLKAIVSNIKHHQFEILLRYGGIPYLQVKCSSKCNVTGEDMTWTGRKWQLSYYMTPGEIVQTALAACLMAAEHECREQFTYKGITIFDPHIDLDEMVRLRLEAGIKGRD